jgi:hypothetical protein
MDEDTIRNLLYFFTGTPGLIDDPSKDYNIIFNNGEFVLREPDSTRPKESDEMLPIAHTCFSQLVLPNYSTEEIMKTKLLKAIELGDGFGFA